MRAEHLREWLREHRAGEVAKVKPKEAEAEVEGEKSGPESEDRERKAKEGISDGVEERETTKWDKMVELV